MDDRARILAALGPGSTAASTEPSFRTPGRKAEWAAFGERLQLQGGKLATLDDLKELAAKRAWADEDAKPFLAGFDLRTDDDIWQVEVGFTTADWAIAESGSLLLSAGPGKHRMASLAPEIHVAFVRRDRLVATLDEALDKLTDRTSVLITGSSRTADIEGILVRGVHGPREVWVVPIDD